MLEKANASAVYTKEQVNAITGTPDEGKTLVAMITEKANAANVYTKADVYTKTETNTEINKVTDSIGTIPAGSTVMAEIAKAQKDATYDDEEVRGLIDDNAEAIANITNADGGLIAVAKQEALDAVATLANGAVADNTAAIAILNGDASQTGSVAKIADDRIAAALAGADADFDTLKEMSDWLSEHKGSAAEMNSAISDNTAAIGIINDTTIPAAIATAKEYTDQQITALDLANNYDTKGAAAKALTDANKYTDDKFAEIVLADIVATEVEGVVTKTAKAGLIAPEVDKFEVDDGKVTKISTDLLAQGSMTLVLNGGNAKA